MCFFFPLSQPFLCSKKEKVIKGGRPFYDITIGSVPSQSTTKFIRTSKLLFQPFSCIDLMLSCFPVRQYVSIGAAMERSHVICERERKRKRDTVGGLCLGTANYRLGGLSRVV